MFSPEYLEGKGNYVRRKMDPEGYVTISFLAEAKNIRDETQDFDLIQLACRTCDVLEVIEDPSNSESMLVRRKQKCSPKKTWRGIEAVVMNFQDARRIAKWLG